MSPTNQTQWSPAAVNLIDVVADGEEQLARAFEAAMNDPAVIGAMAQAWRGTFAASASIPRDLRSGDPTAASDLRRGSATDGRGEEHARGLGDDYARGLGDDYARGLGDDYARGLGDDYPVEMFEQLRAGWAGTADGLALQQAALTFGLGDTAARLHNLAAAIRASDAPDFARTPKHVVLENEDLRLHRIVGTPDEGEPLLLTGSFINRWYVLDFLPGKSFLGQLSELGGPVYLAEWRAPSRARDERGLGELTAGPLCEAIDHVVDTHGEAAALIGYCMGGTFATLAAARYPEKVSRLATVCTPTQFDGAGAFATWFAPEYLDIDAVTAAHDRVPAWLVHLPFWWLRPTVKASKLVSAARSFEREGYLDHMLALEVWNHDNVDQSRGVFRDWAGALYQRDALVNGQFHVDGQAARLETITKPTMVIAGAADNITPLDACAALNAHVSSEYAKTLTVPNGHVGVLTSRRALEKQLEGLHDWLAA